VPELEESAIEPANDGLLEAEPEVLQEPGETYTIKVDGEEFQVSLDELQNGYQRQADYTRKTQEISAERDRLQQAEAIVSALEADPKATLEALAQTLDVSVDLGSDSPEEDEYLDPTEKKLRALEVKVEQQEAAERQRSVDREVQKLYEQYGEFDRRELLNHAVKNKISNLDAAYAHWQFNDLKSTADKLQEERDITETKRSASVITPGGSTQAGTQTQAPKAVSSIREAFTLAKQQLGT